MIKLLLYTIVYLTTTIGASASRSQDALVEWTVVRVPVCTSEQLAAQVYWSAEQYGQQIAEALYLAPLQALGQCSWYDLFASEDYLFPCRMSWSYDCDAVEWSVRGGKFYMVIWPKRIRLDAR